jgi:hypothetical protein
LRVPERLAGKRGRCEHCGAVNEVPLADVDPAPIHPVEPPPEPPIGASSPAPPDAPAEATPPHVKSSPDLSVPPEPPDEPDAFGEAEEPQVATATATAGDDGVVQVLEIPTPEDVDADADELADEPSAFASARELGVTEAAREIAPQSDPSPVAATAAVDDEWSELPAPPPEIGPAAGDVDDVAPSSGVLWSAEEFPDADSPADDDQASPPMEVVEIADAIPAQPEVVAVDVRRATGVSPFRSTADVESRQPIEGTVDVPGAHFAATTLSPTVGVPGDFLNEVAQRIADLPGSTAPAPGPEVRVLDVELDDAVRSASAAAAIAYPQIHPYGPLQPAPAPRNAVLTALVVGLIIGFCAGLMLSGWL